MVKVKSERLINETWNCIFIEYIMFIKKFKKIKMEGQSKDSVSNCESAESFKI